MSPKQNKTAPHTRLRTRGKEQAQTSWHVGAALEGVRRRFGLDGLGSHIVASRAGGLREVVGEAACGKISTWD